MANYSMAYNQFAANPSTGRAAVFLNAMIPVGMGHIGWGFEARPGFWYYGGLETVGLVINKGVNNNTNNSFGSIDEMMKNMKGTLRPGCTGAGYPYHDVKFIDVSKPNLKAALAAVNTVKNRGYGLFGNNCMDAAYYVIKAFANGNGNILPWPCLIPIPRFWHGAIKAKNVNLQSQWSTGNWINQHAA